MTNYVFLTGAGISLSPPSNIPDGGAIIKILLKWISKDDNDYEKLENYLYGENKTSLFDFLRFELLLEKIHQFEPSILDMLSILEQGGFANTNHYFLAAMLKKDATVLTTNFDNRIEEACEDIGYTPKSLYLPKMKNFNSGEKYNYIKLHGTFPRLDSVNKNIPVGMLTQIGKTGFGFHSLKEFNIYIEQELRDKTLVVLGYSASDSFDVVPLLENIEFKKIIWLDYEPCDLYQEDVETIDPMQFPNKEIDPFKYFLSIYKFKYPNSEVTLYKGTTDELYKTISNKDYENAQHNAKNNYDDTFDTDSIEEFKSLLEMQPLDIQSKNMLLESLLNEKYGEWRDGEFSQNDHPIVEKTKEYLYNEDTEKAKQYLLNNKCNIDNSNYNITLGEIYLEEQNFDEALKLFEKETFKGYKQNNLYVIENRISLYIDFFHDYFAQQKLKKAMSMANKVIKHSMNKGIIWGVVEGSMLAGQVNLEYCQLKVLKIKNLKFSPEYYIKKALADFSFASYYALRIARLDMYFEANRFIFNIYQQISKIELAIKTAENLVQILEYVSVEEQSAHLSKLIDIHLGQSNFTRAEELYEIFSKIDLTNKFASILHKRSKAYFSFYNSNKDEAKHIIQCCIDEVKHIDKYWDIYRQLQSDIIFMERFINESV